MTKRKGLDPFSLKQFPEVAGRWSKLKEWWLYTGLEMWAGLVASRFTDHELRVLDQAGYLCENDRMVMRRIREKRDQRELVEARKLIDALAEVDDVAGWGMWRDWARSLQHTVTRPASHD